MPTNPTMPALWTLGNLTESKNDRPKVLKCHVHPRGFIILYSSEMLNNYEDCPRAFSVFT